ncbi:MAG: HD domain-containing protein [Bacteroidetes bacterium]|nr:HD domain-containing protein [Bacteroidota bacterium]
MHINLAMKNFVNSLLETKLPKEYYYHNWEHTASVMDKVITIGKQEDCTEEELFLLETAALWHDTGFINVYVNHEEESCVLARHHLPGYGYKNDDIDTICGMIMATKIPQSPYNKLEEIIADADLEYLGTDYAASRANDLFKEMKFLNPALTETEWNRIQVSFIQQHTYFTDFCKKNNKPKELNYLEKLMGNSV